MTRTLTPGHFPEEERKILREVALTYRRAQRAGKGQNEAAAAAIAEYRRLNPYATGDKLAVSGEVNRMIAAAINVNPEMVLAWAGCEGGSSPPLLLFGCKAPAGFAEVLLAQRPQ
jgi:hypothetical protein